jgi:hypothetical protein
MGQQNALLIECVLKIDDRDEFYRLMANEEYQVISYKIYRLQVDD